MIPQRFFPSKSFFVIPALLLAVACGSAATAVPQAAVQPTAAPQAAVQPTAAPQAAVQPTAAPAPKAAAQPAAAPKPAAKALIAEPVIDPDRNRKPEGKMTIAVHVSISPNWMNPQEIAAGLMSYELAWKVQDNMIKPMPGTVFTYALADRYEMSNDFMHATLRLREGVKFHDGTRITSEDVKFSYDNYHGANAAIFKEFTDNVEIIDDRTVKINFKKPFLDFLLFYGTPASGIGMIIPKAYYLSLGPTTEKRDEAYIKRPIGAGPYKFVRQDPGIEVEFEANTDYWRKVPHVKTIISRGVRELPVRVAALKAGEADFAYFMTGDLLKSVIDDPKLGYDPNNSAPFWLAFPDMNKPDSPFHDLRVRKAVSLALDRQYLSDKETAGMAVPTGNFIPPEWPGVVQRGPDPYDLAMAKRLMAEAGYPNGFKIDWFTPFPAVESLSLRIMEQLREIGIKSEMQVMERPVYMEKQAAGMQADKMGHKGFPGRQIVQAIDMTPGNAATYINNFARCNVDKSLVCDDRIDALWNQFLKSNDLAEREELMKKAQSIILDEYFYVPIYINAFTLGVGERVAGKPADYTQVFMSAIPGPNEDFKLKPGK